ncbi:MAG: hypothetical protein EBR81_08945 [Proteobacteria bacterium]|nr:hypothetical protein [Pseudomonadota bacterium]
MDFGDSCCVWFNVFSRLKCSQKNWLLPEGQFSRVFFGWACTNIFEFFFLVFLWYILRFELV